MPATELRPDPAQVREAGIADVAQVAQIHVRSWQVAYQGLLPEELLAQLDPKQRAERWSRAVIDGDPILLVAVDGADQPVGFVAVGASRDDDADGTTGEVYALYLDPDRQRRGHGRALLTASVLHLRETGFSVATLWVAAGNQQAVRFYEDQGWEADGTMRRDAVGECQLEQHRYRREL